MEHNKKVRESLYTGLSRANSAHLRQSGPETGPGFQVKHVKTFQVVPLSCGGAHGPGPESARSASSRPRALWNTIRQSGPKFSPGFHFFFKVVAFSLGGGIF